MRVDGKYSWLAVELTAELGAFKIPFKEILLQMFIASLMCLIGVNMYIYAVMYFGVFFFSWDYVLSLLSLSCCNPMRI